MAPSEVEIYCLLDSGSTHTILNDKAFFTSVTLRKSQVKTLAGPVELIDGFGTASLVLPHGTVLHLEDALLSGRSRRNLLSFRDVRLNGYHIETLLENGIEFLCVTSQKQGNRVILEKLEMDSFGLYTIPVRAHESYATKFWRLVDPDIFGLWHNRLGHPGSNMMRKLIEHTRGHPLRD